MRERIHFPERLQCRLHKGRHPWVSRNEHCNGNCGFTRAAGLPKIVADYNRFMSGVDRADQLMVYYAYGRKSLKWYKRVFWRMVDHAILNAFVLHKSVISPNPRKYTQKFQMELSYALTAPFLANRIG